MTTDQRPSDTSILSGLRRIGFVSTSRADSGVYRSLWRALIQAGFDVACYAGGTHLDARYGSTIDDLKAVDGLRVVPVRHSTGDGSAAGVAAAAGEATIAFGRAIDNDKPELLFVLGDRLEMLAATYSAVVSRRLIGHLHGGERTAGAYDDKCRDAITMMSDLHFASLPAYADRLRSMVSDASRVFCVGSLAVDRLHAFTPLSIDETSRIVGLDMARPTLLVLLHPETLSALSAVEQAGIVVDALGGVEGQLLILGVNADVGSDAVSSALSRLCATRNDAVMMTSLPPDVFGSCMVHARAMIGNSSSGIIEAASIRLPVVNIGERQGGRVRGANVVDVAFERRAIVEGVRKATSASFRAGLAGLANPYGDGHAARRIRGILRGETIDEFR